ncbi:hypothetical protein QN277_013335 [Acacia crassicarpa]|uniref:DUF7780 domain-containing protein n=1 Tax=Acacia crassicarpa TaxID=499986 RepID=A0AAE1N348_9FABA|nr:hypothetical protein QN277_013335 [Acacia crassicarpa]
MGLSAKAKAKSGDYASTADTNRNMGLLVVFFPEDDPAIADKTKLFSSPSVASSSSSSSPSRFPGSSFRKRNSSFLLSKAQFTISICALFIFTTLLLFTLSTFEPSNPSPRNTLLHSPPRRFLSQKPPTTRNAPNNPTSKSKIHSWLPQIWKPKPYEASKIDFSFPSTALQRMGTLYRRGTRAMSDLVVAHVVEDTTDDELRLFLRVLHRSGLTDRADVVFIFDSASSSSRFGSIIQEENDLFLSLIDHYTELNLTDASLKKKTKSNFDAARFFRVGKKGNVIGETLWGKKSRINLTNPEAEKGYDEVAQLSYGSVLSFDATELDPENALGGFFDHVPLKLRRWACYPMFLGRVRRNFKHVMLVDAKNLVVTSDPFGRVRNRSSESVFVYHLPDSKHSKKISDRSQSKRPVDSAVIMGGERGIRRLSNAMLIGIVRDATQHKKNTASESAVLSQLVGNDFVLKNINLITSTESIPDATSLGGRNSPAFRSLSDYPIIQRGTSNRELNSIIKKQLCSSDIDSSVYRDC